MGLHLTGKGSIWDAIGGAASTIGNAVVGGIKDVGDLGSLAAGMVTGNQVAQQHANQAIENNSNLNQDFVHNASTLPVVNMLNGVPSSPFGDVVKMAAAKVTDNPLAMHNAQDNLHQQWADLSAPKPDPYTVVDGKKVINKEVLNSVSNLAMGALHAGPIKGARPPELPPTPKDLTPKPVPTEPIVNPEDAIHQANPMAPKVTTDKVAPIPEPAPVDLAASQRAAEAAVAAPKPIDYTQVDGASALLKQAINDRAQTLQSMDAGATGGQLTIGADGTKVRTTNHSPFYSDYYAENGRKPSQAAYRQEAERQLRAGNDAESQNYKHLQRHAQVETEMKSYQQADRQSGYNKVRTKAPAGTPKKGMNAAQLEKFQSPEYAARLDAWQKLDNAKNALDTVTKQIKGMDKQRVKIKNPEQLRVHSEKSMPIRMQRNLLQNLVRQYSRLYGEADQALEARYGDTILRKPGTRKSTTVSSEPTTGTFKIDENGKVALAETPKTSISTKANKPYSLEEALGHPMGGKTYDGPNLNENAFDPAELRALQDKPEAVTGLPTRNLSGDEAAYQALLDGATPEEAMRVYQEKAGVDASTAKSAVNYLAEEAQLPDTEALRQRNPSYGSFPETAPKNLHDVNVEVKSYSRSLEYGQKIVNKAVSKMDEHDLNIFEHSRGKSPEELINAAHKPDVMETAITTMDKMQNDMHEIRRINGADDPYRENYRAGLHTVPEADPGAEPAGAFKDELDRLSGYSRPRNINNYEDISSLSGRTRQHSNMLEDFTHDVHATLGYAHDRAVQRGVNELHGNDATVYGAPDSNHRVQLNNTQNVFTNPEIAKKWNKLNPEQKDRAWFLKPYDAATSGIVQAVVVNPGIHGSNQLVQGFEAAGKISRIGADGGGKFAVNLAHHFTKDDVYQFYKEGNHSPSYQRGERGIVSKITRGATDINKNTMAAMELHIRLADWKTLREGGLDANEARRVIDDFMGSDKAMGDAAANFGFFIHYFKTTTGSIIKTVRHPVQNSGVIVNAAIAAGVIYGLNQAWKNYTGNNNAYVHTPGNVGTAVDIYKTGRNIYNKHYLQATGIIGNRINPVAKETASQILNKDMTYGGQIAPNGTASERLRHAAGLTPETAAIGNSKSGKKTPAESLENFFGAYTPHAKGYQATTNPQLTALNEPNAKPGNGLDQQKAFFDSTEEARNSLSPARRALYDRIVASEHDANGTPKSRNDKETQAHYAELYSHPDVLEAIAKQRQSYAKRTGAQVDPLYDPNLSPDKRAEYAHIQSLPYKGDDYIQQTIDPATGKQNSWLKDLTTARAEWYKKQSFAGAPTSEKVLPPSFDPQTEADMTTAGGLTGPEKVQFIDSHPNIQNAYDAIAKYTNDRRVAQGNAPFKLFPKADIETQGIINNYMGMSKAGRSAFIKSNPDAYAKMQDYFAHTSEWELANSAGQDKYQGASPSQTMLKSAYNLGNYDIAKDPNTGIYSINPRSANTASNSSYAKFKSYSSASNKKASFDRTVRNAYNYSKRNHNIRVRTLAQNRAANPRPNRKGIRVTAKPTTGKLRVKSATV